MENMNFEGDQDIVSGSKHPGSVFQANVPRNLNGQKLGRKGLVTRQKILDAARKLIDESSDLNISLSGIAAESSLGMTSIYNYFADLQDVLLALLDDAMLDAEDTYLNQIRTRWDDEELAEQCRRFVHAIDGFWLKHGNLLHLRNNFADGRDVRMISHRVSAAQEIIRLLIFQMDGDLDDISDTTRYMAAAIHMGMERALSVLNNKHVLEMLPPEVRPDVDGLLDAEVQLLEFAVQKMRGTQAG